MLAFLKNICHFLDNPLYLNCFAAHLLMWVHFLVLQVKKLSPDFTDLCSPTDMVWSAFFDTIVMAWKRSSGWTYSRIFRRKPWKITKPVRATFPLLPSWACITVPPSPLNLFILNYSLTQHLFASLSSFPTGQLYGLEKFWAFLKYSKAKNLDIDPKLQEYLGKFRRLEDFRVDVSFPVKKTRPEIRKETWDLATAMPLTQGTPPTLPPPIWA